MSKLSRSFYSRDTLDVAKDLLGKYLVRNIDGKRLAGAHFIFNLVPAFIAIILIDQIMFLVDIISSFLGINDTNYTLKLGVFDSLFKIMGVIIFIPFINKLVVFLEATLKENISKGVHSIDTVRYLNDSVLELSETSMAAIIRETKHLYENAFEIITHGLNLKRINIISSMPLAFSNLTNAVST